jgi:hypothetical protein
MKEIFVDLVERFIEPCQEEKWTKNEVKLFLDEYKKKAHQLTNICRYENKIIKLPTCSIIKKSPKYIFFTKFPLFLK